MHPSISSIPPKSSNLEQSRWFAEEVQPHGASLKAYLRGSFPTVRDVEDLVQESYLRVWRAKMAGSVESARGFLFCAARNLAIDLLRRRRRSPFEPLGDSVSVDVIDDRQNAFEATDTHEKIMQLGEALDTLPPRQRQIVILCKLQSKSHREVAGLLGLSEKTVTEHVYRGVQRLGAELQRRGVRHFAS